MTNRNAVRADVASIADTIASNCVALRMRMLNRVVTGIYDDAFRPLGLKASQLNILVAAAKLRTARPADVATRLHLDLSTLSRNVERMKARGWLTVVPDSDGRAQPFQLTAEGAHLLKKALPAWTQAQAQIHALLGASTVKHLNRSADKLRKPNP